MSDYKLMKQQLIRKNVKFGSGLTNIELEKIEKIYSIKFPYQYKKFLKVGIPISDGFYNWRDFNPDNIAYIKEKMSIPFKDIRDNCEEIDSWPSSWGIRPKSKESLKKEIDRLLGVAPKLIPIYSHRYIPMVYNDSFPVFSIMGLDIIYYGENLYQYLEVEFKIRNYSDIEFNNIEYIDFWSDTIYW